MASLGSAWLWGLTRSAEPRFLGLAVPSLFPPPRLALVCTELGLKDAAAQHEDTVGQVYITEVEQAR